VKILITGGSSFTGYWFIRELAAAGHEVFATFTRSGAEQYDELRARRINETVKLCNPVWNCAFGDDVFRKLIEQEKNWDLLCHHGAFVQDYKSIDFDVTSAVEANTNNLQETLARLTAANCDKLLLTGSVFEQDEGIGEQPLKAFSPYGLSKGLTSEIFKFWCQHFGMRLARFVIPNPFGPFEEKRFTAYLINNWLNGNTPSVNTPDYVRDNIHVSLLAKAYCQFAEEQARAGSRTRLNPCGYIESQGAFAQRLASEMKSRLGKPCDLELAKQEVFDEPRIRVNFDQSDSTALNWDEKAAWDALAEYYLANHDQ
jgi:nucleoside-diphosphate-sugar epimerase